MGQPKDGKFDSREVEWIIDRFSIIKSKTLNKIIGYLLPKLKKYMNYLQKLLLKLAKRFGSRIIRFLGMDPPGNEVIRLKEYLLPLPDGAKLATDVYLPKSVFKKRYKAPTILIRLPYWKDLVCILGYFFASMGYVTILQDTRGCAHSKKYGTNSFQIFEGFDGIHTLLWITKQFWYNRKIGMWGISYLGITQLAIAATLTEETKGLVTCLNPGMASYHNVLYHPYGLIPTGMLACVYNLFKFVSTFYDVKGIVELFQDKYNIPIRLLKYPIMNLYNEKLEKSSWILHFNDLAKIEDLQQIISIINEKLGLNLKINEEDKNGEFQKLLKLVTYDRKLNPQSLLFPHGIHFDFKPTVPMLYIAGHYDMFQEEFIRDVKLYQKTAPEYFKTNFKAIIGPWGHGGMDLAFNNKGSKSLLFNLKDIVQLARFFMPMWYFDYFLKKGKKDITRIPPLQIYILNRKIWRNFKSYPPKTTKLNFFLHSGGAANSRYGDGKLSTEPPGDETEDIYTFDPANPVVTKGGRHLFLVSGPHDQSKIEERNDVLVYSTKKLIEGIEIIGEVKLVFYAASSAKDTDFMAKLVDVKGKKAINILDDGIRARFREGDLENPSYIEPEKIYKYEINLGNIAIYFPKGHRIRLEITSSNFPRFDINSNLAGEDHEGRYITANQRIYHNSQNPSHLILPVYKRY